MKKRAYSRILVILVIFILLISITPVRAIKIAALFHGCNWEEVMNAEFEKKDDIGIIKSVYKTNATLPDKLTGSGHSTWYVYKIVLIDIPIWAGNA
ncbi:MAG: hypothetical protein PUA89_07595, partial [Frisingicoccus sp.]|uniref:hypothetical protein n=1 Tax=Frisingicoccus sp. TaxID=1918627 RepID=UPI00261A0E8F